MRISGWSSDVCSSDLHPKDRPHHMTQLTAMDEHLIHQIPAPLPATEVHHLHWRESYFFIAHRPDQLGDLVILPIATSPPREPMDSLQMGPVGGAWIMGLPPRPPDDDPPTHPVGPARRDTAQPHR